MNTDRESAPVLHSIKMENEPMSGCISESPVQKDGIPRFWPCCKDCRYRRQCPYQLEELLFCTAEQGCAAAHLLKEEAYRAWQSISCASSIRCLLNIDKTLEDALYQTLRSEMDQVDQLCSQAAKYRL